MSTTEVDELTEVHTEEITDEVTTTRPALSLSVAAESCFISRSKIRRMLDAGEFPNAYRSADGGPNDPWLIPVTDLIAAGLRPQAPAPPDMPAGGADGGEPIIDLRDGHEIDVEKLLLQAEIRRLTDLNGSHQVTIEAAMLALRALPAGSANAGVIPLPRTADDPPPSDAPQAKPRRWPRRNRT